MAAAPPVVRDLNQLIGEIGAAYAPQKELINKQIAETDQSGMAQRAGLAAQQKQTFGQIEQGAQNKGMYFSGFSPDAQAKYTATTYLPALANLESSINQVKAGLYGKTAELDSQTRTQAFNVREGDVAAQRAWQQNQEQMAFQAEQARLAREAEARQQAANRAAQSRSAAASSKMPSTAQFLSQAFSGYKPAYEGGQAYYTEREVVPALMANYNMSEAQAKEQAYAYRKRVFGEGYGR